MGVLCLPDSMRAGFSAVDVLAWVPPETDPETELNELAYLGGGKGTGEVGLGREGIPHKGCHADCYCG